MNNNNHLPTSAIATQLPAINNNITPIPMSSLQKRPRTFWDTVLVGNPSSEEETPLPSSLPSTPTSLSESLSKITNVTNTSITSPPSIGIPYHSQLPPVVTSPVSQFTDSSLPVTLPLPNTSLPHTIPSVSTSRPLVPLGPLPCIQKPDINPRITRKPHTCTQCGSSFARSSHLRLHIRTIHEKLKPFQCEQCPAAFGHVSSKYRHFRTVHLKRRDFSCDRCGQAFAERSAVLKHCRTVHEGSRPYPCNICGFRFHFKLHLSQHISTVHEKQRPHQCTICNACFGQRSSLNRHARQIHGVVTKK